MGYPYDEHSIMQYGEHAFADPADAITMKAKDNQPLGQNSHMDAMDVNKINKLYSCARSTCKFCLSLFTKVQTRGTVINIWI